MAEPLDPIRPKSPEPPPLKRLWKSPPEAEPVADDQPVRSKKKRLRSEPEVEPEASPRKTKKKKAKVAESVDDGTGATKLEETPALDTYQARQRARWIIGGVLSAIGLICLVVILRAFKGSGTEEVREGDPVEARPSGDARQAAELEARVILDMARSSDKLGKTKAALDQLNKLTKTYPSTAAAREAMNAVDRNKHNQPLFGPDQPEQVGGPKPPPSPATANGPAIVKNPEPGSMTAPKPPDASPTTPPSTNPNPVPTPAPPPPTPVARALPSGFRPRFDFPIHSSGWATRIVCDHDGAEMVLVPAATFVMGREDGDPAERPAHAVAVSTYYIDRHEVTTRQFVRFLKETGRPIDAARYAPKEKAGQAAAADEHPVVNVSARDAKAYCLWANRRLPTEAQWELAARSPEGKVSYWNGELPRKDPEKGPRLMEPVMSLPSDLSPFGAYDMAANAWEWTSEYYDSQYYQQFRNLVVDPTGPKESRAKIASVTVKGGSKGGILTWRDGLKTETRLPYLGFRGALPVEGILIAPPPPPPSSGTPATTPGGVVPF